MSAKIRQPAAVVSSKTVRVAFQTPMTTNDYAAAKLRNDELFNIIILEHPAAIEVASFTPACEYYAIFEVGGGKYTEAELVAFVEETAKRVGWLDSETYNRYEDEGRLHGQFRHRPTKLEREYAHQLSR